MSRAPTSPSPSPTTASIPPPKPFRFKRKRSPSPSSSHNSEPPHSHRHRHHHHRHHHRSRRHSNDPSTHPQLHPDAAFRESLFDALADDEGAAFWEGVYGQPIHTYSPYYPSSSSGNTNPSNPDNEASLERMTDEEYVSYVRGKMWEKSHGYIIEERKRRDEKRAKRREREEEGRRWERGVEEALRRGEERRRKGRWKGVWEGYVRGWEGVEFTRDEDGDGDEPEKKGKKQKLATVRDRIPWPVESGKWKNVGREEVERFFNHAPQAAGLELAEVLKRERVRWHPDKMQQRVKGGGIDEAIMKLVTAVFQVVDRLWAENKEKV